MLLSAIQQEIHSLLLFAQDIANSLQSLGLSTISVRDELVADLGDFCPAGGNIIGLTGFDFDAMAQSAIDLLNQLGNFIFDNVVAVQTGIDSSLQTSADIDRQLSKVDINDWQSLIIVIPFVVLTSSLLVGLMMSTYRISPRWFTCLISWFFIPFFAVMVTLAYVACSLTALASVLNAGKCKLHNEILAGFAALSNLSTSYFLDCKILQTSAQVELNNRLIRQ